jgi:hypothetical protein
MWGVCALPSLLLVSSFLGKPLLQLLLLLHLSPHLLLLSTLQLQPLHVPP